MKAHAKKGIVMAFVLLTLTLNTFLIYTAYSHFTLYEALRKMNIIMKIEANSAESHSQVKIHLILINPSKASFNLVAIFSDLYLNNSYLGRKVLSYENPLQIKANSNTSFLITYHTEASPTKGTRFKIDLYIALYSASLPTYTPLRFTKFYDY